MRVNLYSDKLEHYGLRGVTLSWLWSDMINRKQAIRYMNYKYLSAFVQRGVPQGPILDLFYSHFTFMIRALATFQITLYLQMIVIFILAVQMSMIFSPSQPRTY